MGRFKACLKVMAALALLTGCRSSSDSDGSMSVRLVDGPVNGFSEVNVNIQSVEIRGNGGWIILGAPNKTINLLSLVGGVSETLASGTTLPEGNYSQMRLVLGTGNTVRLADNSVVPLTVPSGLQTGIKLVVNFTVAAGTTKDVWIDFDAAHSIQLVQAGASKQYLLRPTVWAYDKVVTGSISGTLTDSGGSPQPLVGATVMAEVVDGAGNPVVSRRVQTGANGAYTLDLLPVGYTYYVVAMPRVGAAAYDAKVSQAYSLTTTNPTFTYNGSFSVAAGVGTVDGAITPTATLLQSDRVDLLKSLSTGGGSQTFVVESTLGVVNGGESFSFTSVPAASYTLRGIRTTDNGDGTSTSAPAVYVNTPFSVTNGATTTVNLGL